MQEPRPLINSTLVIISAMLLLQVGLYFGLTKSEKVPSVRPLAQFPDAVGGWTKTQDGVVEPEVQAVLKADDLLNRYYNTAKQGFGANLFVAAFRSQRTGAVPHSPKNCLPGSGWTWTVSDKVFVALPGRAQPIEVNRYIVQKGDSKSLVMYWYQSRDRAVASEFQAKFYTMWDAIRDNRTDTALVRVVIPLNSSDSNDKAQAAAEDFIRSFYNPLRGFLPS